jgi:hypothetical protein
MTDESQDSSALVEDEELGTGVMAGEKDLMKVANHARD